MRLLLTSHPTSSHLVPGLVPLAQVARALGHEVAVAVSDAMAGELAAHGVPCLPLRGIPDQQAMRTDPELTRRYGLPTEMRRPGERMVYEAAWRKFSRAYAGPVAGHLARVVLAEDWQPDVIVSEATEHGGRLVASVLGIPHVVLDNNPLTSLQRSITEPVLREQLAELSYSGELAQHRRAGLASPRCYPAAVAASAVGHYRVPAPLLNQPGLQPELAALPTDRPLALMSLGSLILTLDGMHELLEPILQALGELPCEVVLTLGGSTAVASALGSVPANVHVTDYVPQAALLESCRLFITHAGFNAYREALAAGAPMVALPLMADQPVNSDRIVALGVGERLDIESFTAADLRAACLRVLTRPEPRRNARAVQRELLTLPGLEQLVRDLEALPVPRVLTTCQSGDLRP
ncbi:MAG TPA: glycosyltransferase [Jatrophihabitans sp.]|jgi:N-glycosyltransferase|uniref:glycosyltransferase n=1 Tax=Jatrophihabitans sp. TaxID=1932789 RepID=UPI002F101E4E